MTAVIGPHWCACLRANEANSGVELTVLPARIMNWCRLREGAGIDGRSSGVGRRRTRGGEKERREGVWKGHQDIGEQ